MPKAPGYSLILLVAALFAWLLEPLAEAQTALPIRIMPLGDSITSGNTGIPATPFVPGGYREPLYNSLGTAGYAPDFVGTLTLNPPAGLADHDHEGHPGWQIHEVDGAIAGWLAAVEDPDVILLHLGTNDLDNYRYTDTPGYNPAVIIGRFDALIGKIAQLRPFAHIIVTNLLVRGDEVAYNSAGIGANTRIQTYFNPYLVGIVNAHAALGRRVTFLDMRAAVPITDMPDLLHPDQAGYDKMAAAWMPAIQAVMTPLGDRLPPRIVAVKAIDDTHVSVKFNKPVADGATTLANYTINGLTVSGAVLDATTKRTVTLTTSQMAVSVNYTLAISNVLDRLADLAVPETPKVIAPGTTATFWSPALPGAPNNVAEAGSYSLVYSLDVPTSAQFNSTPPAYSEDHHLTLGAYTRVAYYLEVQKPGGPLEFCWTSMDPFTNDAGKIGVPHTATAAIFQQSVAAMRVVSNVAGVVNGSGFTGNVEFWPNDYLTANAANVPGASAATYDFGDQRVAGGDYGSMQIHHPGAAQTLIAFNHWGMNWSNTPDLGIGNNPAGGGQPDWTSANNTGGYSVKKLQVFAFPATKETRLASLSLSEGTLSPAFSGETASYSTTVPHGTSSVTITPTVLWANATVTVNGTPSASGYASAPVALGVGANVINVLVTAQDGVTTRGYTLNVTRQTYYQTWATTEGIGASGAANDFDNDGSSNLLEMAFGTDPTVSSTGFIDLTMDFGPPWQGTINARGEPVVLFANIENGVDMRAVFGRRKDYVAAGLTYTVEFSPDLSQWVPSPATPTVVGDENPSGDIEAVSVPYPLFIDGKKAQFFRVTVTGS